MTHELGRATNSKSGSLEEYGPRGQHPNIEASLDGRNELLPNETRAQL